MPEFHLLHKELMYNILTISIGHETFVCFSNLAAMVLLINLFARALAVRGPLTSWFKVFHCISVSLYPVSCYVKSPKTAF